MQSRVYAYTAEKNVLFYVAHAEKRWLFIGLVKGSAAEVDYIIQHGRQVVPVEVKAGSTGGLKTFISSRERRNF